MAWFRWWHKFVRKHVRPIREETAQEWSQRLSLLYTFFAWNAAGFAGYSLYRGYIKKHELTAEERMSLSSGQQLAKEMGKQNAKIVRVKGFKVITIDPSSPAAQGDSKGLKE